MKVVDDPEDLEKAKQLGTYSVLSADKDTDKGSSSPSGKRRFTVPHLSLPAAKVPRPKIKHRLSGFKGATAILFVLVALVSGFAGAWLEAHHAQTDQADLSSQKKIVTSQSQLISQIAKTVGPSVVSVNVAISSSANDSSGLFGLVEPPQQAQAAGTGIIISKTGLIITNRHVVPQGTTTVSVTLSDGTELKDVSVIGRTNDNDSLDVAFLKVNDTKGHTLKPASLGNSSNVQVGDNVVAIGNALGQFQNTVTSGIISGYGRSIQAGDSSGNSASSENLDNLFQTDTAINEGNSGGPLVNLNGQVIGINTAVAGGNAQNIGFAIPINDVHGLINQVQATGKFARPYLGIRYTPLSSDVAQEFKLKVSSGAFIVPSQDKINSSVLSDGPADKAGLQEGDIITRVNNTKIDQTHSITSLLGAYRPGDKVKLTILRGEQTLHIDVTLGSLPAAQ